MPKNADGTLFPTPSFSSARYDAFDTTNLTTVDLSSAFKAYDDNTLRTTGYNDTRAARLLLHQERRHGAHHRLHLDALHRR